MEFSRNLILNGLLILLGAFAVSASVLTEDIQARIFNGRNAALGQFPYQALLYSKGKNGFYSFCGGSLITTSYVLTAAHCCQDMAETKVYLGMVYTEHVNNSGVVKRLINNSSMTIHEEYNPKSLQNDICLVGLSEPVELSDTIKTISYIRQDMNPSQFDMKNVKISGWGQTNNSEVMHPYLQFSELPILPHYLCILWYSVIQRISEKQICTGKLPVYSGACHGDSGGPLTVNGDDGKSIQIGLVSWGVGSCDGSSPIVFTYVGAYSDWIKEHTSATTSSPLL